MGPASLSPEELVRVCTQSGDPIAWEEFIRRFHRLIAGVVLRTARHWGEPSSQFVDDLVQETYLKLCDHNCRLLREFESQHPDSIFGFLKVVAANVVRDHYKFVNAQKRGAGQHQESLNLAEAAHVNQGAGSPAAMERNLLLKEIERHLNECAAGAEHQRDRMIFWLYYRQGLTARAIASLPTVALNIKGVESTILRMTRLIRNQMTAGASRPELNTGLVKDLGRQSRSE